MLSEISQLTSIGLAIKDFATALIQERDSQKLAAIKIDLTDKIIELQAKLLEVQGTIISEREALRVAQDHARDMERSERERSRYELAKLGAFGDFFAYRLRPPSELTERQTEPSHFICQSCLDVRKQKVVMQRRISNVMGEELICPVCKDSMNIG
jgi:hypothetical protein